MGKIDVCGKTFFENKERFAELVNVHIYGGKKLVRPEGLRQLKGKYPSVSSPSGEKERDILMEHRKSQVYYGLELEEVVDYSMPERMMNYDTGEYERQIREIVFEHNEKKAYENYEEKKSRLKAKDKLNRVKNMVLYLGEGRWDGPTKLSDLFADTRLPVDSEDYEIQVIESDFVDPKDYQTDLKEFFQALQCRNDKVRLKGLFRTEAFQNLTFETQRAILVSLKLEKVVIKMQEEEMTMCRAFEELMNDQWEGGKEEGENLLANLLSRLFSDNRDEDARLAVNDETMRKQFYLEYGMTR